MYACVHMCVWCVCVHLVRVYARMRVCVCVVCVCVCVIDSLPHMCSSEEKESRGERVPLVRMTDLTPCAVSSLMAWPGLKHQ